MTDKTLQEEINSAIIKNLPAQTASLLQKRLDELEEIEEKYNSLQKENKLQRTKIDSLALSVDKLADERKCLRRSNNKLKTMEETVLKPRQDSLETWELKLIADQQILALKEQHAEEKCSLMKELFSIPFQNRTLRESINTQVPIKTQEWMAGSQYNNTTCSYNEELADVTRMEDVKTTKVVEES